MGKFRVYFTESFGGFRHSSFFYNASAEDEEEIRTEFKASPFGNDYRIISIEKLSKPEYESPSVKVIPLPVGNEILCSSGDDDRHHDEHHHHHDDWFDKETIFD